MKTAKMLFVLVALTALQGCSDNHQYEGRYRASTDKAELNSQLKGTDIEFMEIGESYIDGFGERHEVTFKLVQKDGTDYLHVLGEMDEVLEFEVINENQLKMNIPELGEVNLVYTRIED